MHRRRLLGAPVHGPRVDVDEKVAPHHHAAPATTHVSFQLNRHYPDKTPPRDDEADARSDLRRSPTSYDRPSRLRCGGAPRRWCRAGA